MVNLRIFNFYKDHSNFHCNFGHIFIISLLLPPFSCLLLDGFLACDTSCNLMLDREYKDIYPASNMISWKLPWLGCIVFDSQTSLGFFCRWAIRFGKFSHKLIVMMCILHLTLNPSPGIRLLCWISEHIQLVDVRRSGKLKHLLQLKYLKLSWQKFSGLLLRSLKGSVERCSPGVHFCIVEFQPKNKIKIENNLKILDRKRQINLIHEKKVKSNRVNVWILQASAEDTWWQTRIFRWPLFQCEPTLMQMGSWLTYYRLFQQKSFPDHAIQSLSNLPCLDGSKWGLDCI